MKKYQFTISPYATQTGHITVPDDTPVDADYISNHWEDVTLGEPDMDYCGCDIDDIEPEN
jgi:hypothetical protein